MSRGKPKPVVLKLHELQPGKHADFFALLAEKTRNSTRDGKPFYSLKFRDRRRVASAVVWADGPHFADCQEHWHAGQFYKVRGTFGEHERYGPQVEIEQLRPVRDDDRADGFREDDYLDRSRFDPDETFARLDALAAGEIADVPLRTLVRNVLAAHVDSLKRLPATPRHFYPFPGGWLEHTLSVAASCVYLADKYVTHYPDLSPPLNRDLVVAGAVLHDVGRVLELEPAVPDRPAEPGVDGRLFGHLILGRDLVRDAARDVPDLNPELLRLLEHLLLTHLGLPEWGSPRLPLIPEVLIVHHADDLDAKLEMFARCLTRDAADGPFTERDPVLGRQLLRGRTV